MPPGPENPTTAWQTFAESLGGSFTARARGLLNPELVFFDRNGDPSGGLAPHGDAGATLTSGYTEARVVRTNPSFYEMTSNGASLLTAQAENRATRLEIRSSGRTYKARISLLRNQAAAQNPEERTIARVSGGFSNRRYKATFDPEDPAALPAALFLLYRLVTLRSGAYQTR